jgi:hypothetical protein
MGNISGVSMETGGSIHASVHGDVTDAEEDEEHGHVDHAFDQGEGATTWGTSNIEHRTPNIQ